MGIPTGHATRLLPAGTPLHNRLLAALPAADYARIQKRLRMNKGETGRTLQEHGERVTEVYFPNGGVFSVTKASVSLSRWARQRRASRSGIAC